jgi:hypothetical protein
MILLSKQNLFDSYFPGAAYTLFSQSLIPIALAMRPLGPEKKCRAFGNHRAQRHAPWLVLPGFENHYGRVLDTRDLVDDRDVHQAQ